MVVFVMTITTKLPTQCTQHEIMVFAALVVSGGQATMAPAGLRDRIMDARNLCFVKEANGDTIAVGALKNSRLSYRVSVFNKAGYTGAYQFGLELGWFVVSPAHRGKGLLVTMVETLMRQAGGDRLFATTRIDNAPMMRVLLVKGFSKVGNDYDNIAGDGKLALYVKT